MTLGRPATGLPRYYMDVDWHRGPKWAGAGPEALAVHPIAVGYCTKHASDGRLPADLEDLSLALGVRLTVLRKALKELVDDRRWSRDGGQYVIVGYEDHNPVAAEVAEHAERQRTRGALGNHRRWHENRGVTDPECPYCDSPGDSPSDDRQAISPQGDRQGTASPGESLGMGWDGMGNPPTPSSDSRAATPGDPRGGDQHAVIEQAVHLAAQRHAQHQVDHGAGRSIDGLTRYWMQENADGARIRARQLLADYDLGAVQLADALGHATAPRWLANHRRRPLAAVPDPQETPTP